MRTPSPLVVVSTVVTLMVGVSTAPARAQSPAASQPPSSATATAILSPEALLDNGEVITTEVPVATPEVPAATPVVPAATPRATSYDMDATYEVSVHLDWDTRRVKVDTVIAVRNTSGVAVRRLELNTVAAKLGGMKSLRVKVDGAAVEAKVAGQTIRVPLAAPLAADASTVVGVSFRARLLTTTSGRDFMWSKTSGIAQMYRFIPWLSRRIPFGPTVNGEPFVTPVSSMVRVTVSADRPLVWATSGRRVSKGRKSRTFVANQVRDFNLSASPYYKMRAGKSKDGDTRIKVYTIRADGKRLLTLAKRELARYQKLLGPYPYPTFGVAEVAGPIAMESPALIWIDGSRSPVDHPFLVSHETAHQWFYGIVGNDQATDAFADEALADYLARHFVGYLRRSNCRQDRLDRNVHAYKGCYHEVIYVQGGLFLDKLRRDFGNAKFWKAVRTYARDQRFLVASNRRLLEAFRTEMGDKVLKRYRLRFPSIY